MPSIQVDVPTFNKRLNQLYQAWKASRNDPSLWKDADALVLNTGKPSDILIYQKSNALHNWFFGYEFPETLMVFCEKQLLIVTSANKVEILKPLAADSTLPVKIELITKKEDNKEAYQKLISGIQDSFSGKVVASLIKETPEGEFVESWEKTLKNTEGLEIIDASYGFADVLAIKDAQGVKNAKTAAAIASHIMTKNLLPQIETVIDEEQSVSHKKLSETTEKLFEDPTKISKKLTPDVVDVCYTPLIQSGGVFDPKPGVAPTDDPLHFGTIICSLGARFKSYCANVARTYFVDPTKDQEAAYKILLEVEQRVIKALKPEIPLNAVMQQALSYIETSAPHLVDKFTRSCGFSMGIEFQESAYILNAKNQKLIRPGMIYNVSVGFNKLETESTDEKKKVYSMLLSDTVLVKENGEAEILTDKCSKKYSDISYFLTEEKQESKPAAPSRPSRQQTIDSEAKARAEEKAKQKKNAEDKRKEHQKLLEEKKRKELAERFAKQKQPKSVDNTKLEKVESYKSHAEFPRDAERGKIYVDTQRESILLPIYGTLVPFHISTVKNASKTDEEYLRINFVTPESTTSLTQKQLAPIAEASAFRIKEVTYRIPDVRSLNNSLRLIKELRKRVTSRETEKRETANLIAQEKLILSKNRAIPRLSDVFVRPNPAGRRTMGMLEAHQNGFRFTAVKGLNIDVLYKNIKHAFFQPAENELLVLVHFHLHNAIMVGKKKTNDIQFCTEVMEVSQALDGKHKYDPDEIEDEQRERQMKARLNTEFQNFVRKVDDLYELEFDIPYRELGFTGVPHRAAVFIQPSVHCLVNLTEVPFFILTLSEIEIAYFERVEYSLKNFDMVFVFKDYSKPPIHINSISVEYLETIKEWLDSCDIMYYEGKQNLNWNRIMAVVQADPKKFHTEDGGWNFLNPESSDEDDDEERQVESDYEPEEEEDDYPSDDSDEEGVESDEESYEEEDVSEGEDWETAEERARLEDKQRIANKRARGEEVSDDSEDERRKKKKK